MNHIINAIFDLSIGLGYRTTLDIRRIYCFRKDRNDGTPSIGEVGVRSSTIPIVPRETREPECFDRHGLIADQNKSYDHHLHLKIIDLAAESAIIYNDNTPPRGTRSFIGQLSYQDPDFLDKLTALLAS